MSQTSITSFFNSRKRPATEDLITSKNKVPHIDRTLEKKIISTGTAPLFKRNDFVSREVKQPIKSSETVKDDLKRAETQHVVSSKDVKQIPPKLTAAFGKKVNASNTPKITEAASKAEVITASRKELSLGDIRKKLAGSSRLAELRATADRLSKGIQELKQTSEKRNLREFKSIDVEVPVRYVQELEACLMTVVPNLYLYLLICSTVMYKLWF